MKNQKKPVFNEGVREKKYFGKFKEALSEIPNLVEPQLNSFKWLLEKGIAEVIKDFSPIKDYGDKKFELSFTSFEISEPKHDEHYAKENKMSYDAQLKVKIS